LVRKLLVVAIWGWAAAGLTAQEAPATTPREAWDQVQAQVAQDHAFTPEEVAALADLEEQLDGDGDLGAQVHLLRLALATRSTADQARADAQRRLADDAAAWQSRETLATNRGIWRLSRDVGLWGLGISTVSILGLTAALDRLDQSYGDSREDVKVALRWATWSALGTAFISLFPLTWGEVRQ
jgi:hypothetical protein